MSTNSTAGTATSNRGIAVEINPSMAFQDILGPGRARFAPPSGDYP